MILFFSFRSMQMIVRNIKLLQLIKSLFITTLQVLAWEKQRNTGEHCKISSYKEKSLLISPLLQQLEGEKVEQQKLSSF